MSVLKVSRRGLKLVGLMMAFMGALLLSACGDGAGGGGLPYVVAAPQNLVAHPGSEIVTLTWDAADNADSYTVYWDTTPNVSTSDNTLTTTTTTNATHTGLTNATTYYYRVTATRSGDEGPLSDEKSATPSDWTAASTNPTSENLRALQWNDSIFAVTGATDTWLSSPDADTWTDRNLSTYYAGSYNFNGAAWSASPARFVAVGDSGAILTSPNGTSGFSLDTSVTSSALYGVAWSGSQYIVVGDSGFIVTSPDAATWTPQTSGTSNVLRAVTWGNSQFVAVGDGGTVLTSANGTSWTTQTSGITAKLSSVLWGGSQYVAVGDSGAVLTSTDGINWTALSVVASNLNAVSYNGALYLAAGDGGVILSSADAKTWTEESFSPTNNLYAVSSNDTTDVVAGNSGVIYKRPR